MPTTPNMSMVLPTDHSDADVWGAILNTALTLNDLHDHTTGKGVPVPSAALRINADVAWSFAGTFYALTGVKALDFEPQTAASMSGYASALFTNSSDANNLYFRNQSGTNVKITDGSTLNVSIVGGIGGDYTSIGALVDYDDASDTYRFRQQTSAGVRQFAKMQCADIKLTEYDPAGDASVPANFVTLKSPDALAASYDVTWPAAVPGSGVFLQMATTGALSASNTVTGNVTAADFRHTTAQTMLIHGSAAQVGNGVGHLRLNSSGYSPGFSTAATTARIHWPIQIQAGCVITGYTLYAKKTTNGSTTLFTALSKTSGTTSTSTNVSAGASNAANNPGFITISESGLSVTVTNAGAYFVELSPVGGGTADETYHVEVTFTRP